MSCILTGNTSPGHAKVGCQSGIPTAELHTILARVNSLLEQKGEEQPSENKIFYHKFFWQCCTIQQGFTASLQHGGHRWRMSDTGRTRRQKNLRAKVSLCSGRLPGGEIQYMMYRVIHQSCKLFLEGFTYCCSFKEEFLPGQSAWKRPGTSEPHWSHPYSCM